MTLQTGDQQTEALRRQAEVAAALQRVVRKEARVLERLKDA
jgi:hypothetical protein